MRWLPRRGKSFLCVALAGIYGYTNVVGLSAAESNFWAQRKEAARAFRPEAARAGQDRPTEVGGGPSRLMAQLPAAGLDAAVSQGLGIGPHPLPLSDALARLPSPPSPEPSGIPGWLPALVLPYGSIREAYISRKPDVPLIVHIQDAHQVEEAQRNMARIIQGLQETRGWDLVGLEGAQGPFALEPYRAYPEPVIIRSIADYFLREGYIGGPEFLGLTAPRPPLLWGVEDLALYEEHVRVFKDSLRHAPAVNSFLKELSAGLEKLKAKSYSPALREFDRHGRDYRERREPLGDYVRYLLSLPHPADQYGNLHILADALAREESLDFKKVEADRRQLVERLVRALPAGQIELLVQRSLQHRLGRTSYGDYYRFLRDLCGRHGVPLDSLGALSSYIDYVQQAERINRDRLLAELAGLEEAAPLVLASTAEQRSLLDAARRLRLLEKLAGHEMTPADWESYERGRERIQNVGADLASAAAALGEALSLSFPSDWPEILRPFEGFCRYALERNRGLVQNLLSKMKSESRRNAVLVAGGFHSDGLTRLLREKDVSYVVVTPQIREVPKENRYLDVLARDPLPLEKLVSGEKIYLASPRPLAARFTELSASMGATLQVLFATVFPALAVALLKGKKEAVKKLLQGDRELARRFPAIADLDMELAEDSPRLTPVLRYVLRRNNLFDRDTIDPAKLTRYSAYLPEGSFAEADIAAFLREQSARVVLKAQFNLDGQEQHVIIYSRSSTWRSGLRRMFSLAAWKKAVVGRVPIDLFHKGFQGELQNAMARLSPEPSPIAAAPLTVRAAQVFSPELGMDRIVSEYAPRRETGVLGLLYLYAVFVLPAVLLALHLSGVASVPIPSFLSGYILNHPFKAYAVLHYSFGLLHYMVFQKVKGEWQKRWSPLATLVGLPLAAMMIHAPFLLAGTATSFLSAHAYLLSGMEPLFLIGVGIVAGIFLTLLWVWSFRQAVSFHELYNRIAARAGLPALALGHDRRRGGSREAAWPEYIGPYKIDGVLESRGALSVYRGSEPSRGFPLAVLTPAAGGSQGKDWLVGRLAEMLSQAREGRVFPRLVSQGVDERTGRPFLAVEMVKGRALWEYFSDRMDRPRVSSMEAVAMARYILLALEALHGAGLSSGGFGLTDFVVSGRQAMMAGIADCRPLSEGGRQRDIHDAQVMLFQLLTGTPFLTHSIKEAAMASPAVPDWAKPAFEQEYENAADMINALDGGIHEAEKRKDMAYLLGRLRNADRLEPDQVAWLCIALKEAIEEGRQPVPQDILRSLQGLLKRNGRWVPPDLYRAVMDAMGAAGVRGNFSRKELEPLDMAFISAPDGAILPALRISQRLWEAGKIGMAEFVSSFSAAASFHDSPEVLEEIFRFYEEVAPKLSKEEAIAGYMRTVMRTRLKEEPRRVLLASFTRLLAFRPELAVSVQSVPVNFDALIGRELYPNPHHEFDNEAFQSVKMILSMLREMAIQASAKGDSRAFDDVLALLREQMMKESLSPAAHEAVAETILELVKHRPGITLENDFARLMSHLSRQHVKGLLRHHWRHYRIYQDPDFQRVVEGQPLHARYSIAQAVYRIMEQYEIGFDHDRVSEIAEIVVRRRGEIAERVVFGPGVRVVNLLNEEDRFKPESLRNIAASSAVHRSFMDTFKGPTRKDDALSKIRAPSSEALTIFFSGHGLENGLFLGDAGGGPVSISPEELGEALLNRVSGGPILDLSNVTLLISACYSNNFARNLFSYLKEQAEIRKKVLLIPIIVSSSNFDRYSYGAMPGSFEKARQGLPHGSPFKMRHVYEAEGYAFEDQDFEVFATLLKADDRRLREMGGVPRRPDAGPAPAPDGEPPYSLPGTTPSPGVPNLMLAQGEISASPSAQGAKKRVEPRDLPKGVAGLGAILRGRFLRARIQPPTDRTARFLAWLGEPFEITPKWESVFGLTVALYALSGMGVPILLGILSAALVIAAVNPAKTWNGKAAHFGLGLAVSSIAASAAALLALLGPVTVAHTVLLSLASAFVFSGSHKGEPWPVRLRLFVLGLALAGASLAPAVLFAHGLTPWLGLPVGHMPYMLGLVLSLAVGQDLNMIIHRRNNLKTFNRRNFGRGRPFELIPFLIPALLVLFFLSHPLFASGNSAPHKGRSSATVVESVSNLDSILGRIKANPQLNSKEKEGFQQVLSHLRENPQFQSDSSLQSEVQRFLVLVDQDVRIWQGRPELKGLARQLVQYRILRLNMSLSRLDLMLHWDGQPHLYRIQGWLPDTPGIPKVTVLGREQETVTVNGIRVRAWTKYWNSFVFDYPNVTERDKEDMGVHELAHNGLGLGGKEREARLLEVILADDGGIKDAFYENLWRRRFQKGSKDWHKTGETARVVLPRLNRYFSFRDFQDIQRIRDPKSLQALRRACLRVLVEVYGDDPFFKERVRQAAVSRLGEQKARELFALAGQVSPDAQKKLISHMAAWMNLWPADLRSWALGVARGKEHPVADQPSPEDYLTLARMIRSGSLPIRIHEALTLIERQVRSARSTGALSQEDAGSELARMSRTRAALAVERDRYAANLIDQKAFLVALEDELPYNPLHWGVAAAGFLILGGLLQLWQASDTSVFLSGVLQLLSWAGYAWGGYYFFGALPGIIGLFGEKGSVDTRLEVEAQAHVRSINPGADLRVEFLPRLEVKRLSGLWSWGDGAVTRRMEDGWIVVSFSRGLAVGRHWSVDWLFGWARRMVWHREALRVRHLVRQEPVVRVPRMWTLYLGEPLTFLREAIRGIPLIPRLVPGTSRLTGALLLALGAILSIPAGAESPAPATGMQASQAPAVKERDVRLAGIILSKDKDIKRLFQARVLAVADEKGVSPEARSAAYILRELMRLHDGAFRLDEISPGNLRDDLLRIYVEASGQVLLTRERWPGAVELFGQEKTEALAFIEAQHLPRPGRRFIAYMEELTGSWNSDLLFIAAQMIRGEENPTDGSFTPREYQRLAELLRTGEFVKKVDQATEEQLKEAQQIEDEELRGLTIAAIKDGQEKANAAYQKILKDKDDPELPYNPLHWGLASGLFFLTGYLLHAVHGALPDGWVQILSWLLQAALYTWGGYYLFGSIPGMFALFGGDIPDDRIMAEAKLYSWRAAEGAFGVDFLPRPGVRRSRGWGTAADMAVTRGGARGEIAASLARGLAVRRHPALEWILSPARRLVWHREGLRAAHLIRYRRTGNVPSMRYLYLFEPLLFLSTEIRIKAARSDSLLYTVLDLLNEMVLLAVDFGLRGGGLKRLLSRPFIRIRIFADRALVPGEESWGRMTVGLSKAAGLLIVLVFAVLALGALSRISDSFAGIGIRGLLKFFPAVFLSGMVIGEDRQSGAVQRALRLPSLNPAWMLRAFNRSFRRREMRRARWEEEHPEAGRPALGTLKLMEENATWLDSFLEWAGTRYRPWRSSSRPKKARSDRRRGAYRALSIGMLVILGSLLLSTPASAVELAGPGTFYPPLWNPAMWLAGGVLLALGMSPQEPGFAGRAWAVIRDKLSFLSIVYVLAELAVKGVIMLVKDRIEALRSDNEYLTEEYVSRPYSLLDQTYGFSAYLDRDAPQEILMIGVGRGLAAMETALRFPRARIWAVNKQERLWDDTRIEREMLARGYGAEAIRAARERITVLAFNVESRRQRSRALAGRRFDAVIFELRTQMYLKDKVAALEAFFNEHLREDGLISFDAQQLYTARPTEEQTWDPAAVAVLKEAFDGPAHRLYESNLEEKNPAFTYRRDGRGPLRIPLRLARARRARNGALALFYQSQYKRKNVPPLPGTVSSSGALEEILEQRDIKVLLNRLIIPRAGLSDQASLWTAPPVWAKVNVDAGQRIRTRLFFGAQEEELPDGGLESFLGDEEALDLLARGVDYQNPGELREALRILSAGIIDGLEALELADKVNAPMLVRRISYDLGLFQGISAHGPSYDRGAALRTYLAVIQRILNLSPRVPAAVLLLRIAQGYHFGEGTGRRGLFQPLEGILRNPALTSLWGEGKEVQKPVVPILHIPNDMPPGSQDRVLLDMLGELGVREAGRVKSVIVVAEDDVWSRNREFLEVTEAGLGIRFIHVPTRAVHEQETGYYYMDPLIEILPEEVRAEVVSGELGLPVISPLAAFWRIKDTVKYADVAYALVQIIGRMVIIIRRDLEDELRKEMEADLLRAGMA